jgi:endonuclease/exonuclease/phosphatase family metal-dependent hydrolase
MRLVTYNIQFGRGRDGRFDLRRIADAVREADVIALQEVERYWLRSGMADQPAELAALLPDHHWVYGPAMDMDASFTDIAGKPVHRRRQFGNMLFSRTPILSTRCFPLPKVGTVTQYSLQRIALEGVIAVPGPTGALRVYSIHLTHLADATRGPQVDTILDIHRRAPAEGGAWTGPPAGSSWSADGPPPPMPRDAVLMGDFNLEPSSPLYDRIVGPLSPEHGRMNAIEGFVDAWVAAGHGESEGVTCPRTDSGRDLRIDYCFVSTPLLPRLRGCWIDQKAAGSDHQPVWTELSL